MPRTRTAITSHRVNEVCRASEAEHAGQRRMHTMLTRSGIMFTMLVACGGSNAAPVDAVALLDAPACVHHVVLSFEGATISVGAADDATTNESHLVHGSPSVCPA